MTRAFLDNLLALCPGRLPHLLNRRRSVLEGRRTFANIRKYILMGASSNFGNMFSMAGAAMFLPFLRLLPAQILVNNLMYDISEIPIPLDHADPADVATPQKWDMGFIRASCGRWARWRCLRRTKHCFAPAGSSSRSPPRCW